MKSTKETEFQAGDLVDIIADNCYVGVGVVIDFYQETDARSRPTVRYYKTLTQENRTLFYFPWELRIIQ